MGTNYYHETPLVNAVTCSCCGQPLCCETCDAPRLHIGKSSAGWTFSFQAHTDPPIRSYREWLAHLEAGGTIRDEYGRVISLDDFKGLVERKREAPHHHAREHPDIYTFTDADGHAFSEREFT